MSIAYSKVTSKSQTVIPRDVREKLGLRPGDRLSYRQTPAGIVIEKAGTVRRRPLCDLHGVVERGR